MSLLATLSRFVQGLRMLGPAVTLRALVYPFRKTYDEGRFAGCPASGTQPVEGSALRGIAALLGQRPRPGRGHPSQSIGEYQLPGQVLAHVWHATAPWPQRQQIELTCEHALVRLAILAPDLIQVRLSFAGRFDPPFSYAVLRREEEWPPTSFDVEDTAEALLIRTTDGSGQPVLRCRIDKQPLAISFLAPDGTAISSDAPGAGWDAGGERVVCWKSLAPDEHVYGLGEKTTRLDKRGLAFRMCNTDPQIYRPGDDPIYSNIPFYLGLRDGRGYGILFDNSARGRFDFGVETAGVTRFEAECGEMRTYFFYGPRLATVLERYTELTGRMMMPPLWALGYHQNRWSYFPEARVRQVAAEFRRRRIPCDAIHLDIEYMDGFRCFTWHSRWFPNPGQLAADLHKDGFRVVTMIDPGIKVDPVNWVYRQSVEHDVFCKFPDGKPFRGPVWPGECCFPDFTSPRVRAWWGELYREIVELGIDGFWNDMNEPAVFGHRGDTFPDVVQHDWEGQGADHRQAHNVYGMQMARATTDGLLKLRPTERPLVISRSVWAGSQRHNMHWLGDNHSDWASLHNVPQLVMNMGLSGIPFTGPDTGGFEGTPDAELLIRWNQLSTFTPFFRNHTAKTSGDQEPWALGEECERISRAFIELRYQLLPYLYTAFWQAAQTGMPIMRPLFLAFQDDLFCASGAEGYSIDDQFMCGDALLVAPVFAPGATSRHAYIPFGRWYDFWDGTLTDGPQITELAAPLERIPLLVRAGSILPTWPVMQYTGERPVDVLTLHVYPGNGTSLLYEDDGHTWAFEQGDYRLTHLICEMRPTAEQTTRTALLSIRRQSEGRFTPSYERIRVVVHGVAAKPRALAIDGQVLACPEKEHLDLGRRTYTFTAGLFAEIEMQVSESLL